ELADVDGEHGVGRGVDRLRSDQSRLARQVIDGLGQRGPVVSEPISRGPRGEYVVDREEPQELPVTCGDGLDVGEDSLEDIVHPGDLFEWRVFVFGWLWRRGGIGWERRSAGHDPFP